MQAGDERGAGRPVMSSIAALAALLRARVCHELHHRKRPHSAGMLTRASHAAAG